MEADRFTGRDDKMKIKILLLIALTLSARTWAQTFGLIYTFTNAPYTIGPQGGLTLANDTLYGTSWAGGTNGSGLIFSIKTNGSNYRVLKSFGLLVNRFNLYTNVDGARPSAGLMISGDTIYGTASAGGSFGNGTVFRMNTNGTQFAVLKDFTNDANGVAVEGASPSAGLIMVGNTLYGTVGGGGVFKMNTNGSSFSIIKNGPNGDLLLSGDTLYGLNSQTVFSMKTNGVNYTTIKTFTNSPDGYNPQAGLTLSSNTLYGTTSGGGSTTWGTIYKVNTDGSGYAILKNLSFDEVGTQPKSSLVLIGNTLYGTTYMGGPLAFGALFKINTDGTGFAVVKNFTGNDGQFLVGNLIVSGKTLYGNTSSAGSNNSGTIYSLDATPIIATIVHSISTYKVVWNSISNHVYQLQFTTNLISTNWQNLGNSITATNGTASTLIAPTADAQRLYRINLQQ